jgi:hypothetical protein
LGLVKDLLGPHGTNAWHSFVAIHWVSSQALGPEPVVSFLWGHIDLAVPIEEAAGDLLHVFIWADQNKVRRIKVTLQTKSIISLQIRVTNSFVMLGAPFQKAFVSYWFALGSLTLVVRRQALAEVLGVGEVKGDVVAIEPLSEVVKLTLKDLQNDPEVAGNGDQIITPIQLDLC